MAFEHHSLSGYNSCSSWQLHMALKSIPQVLQNLLSSIQLTPGPLVVADYGCSEGYNSMIYFKTLFQAFREQSDREIFITHTDLPNNNWNIFSNLLNTSEDSYLLLPKIYFSTVGKSFFQQLFPNESVHLGFAAFSFHYISKKPIRKPDDRAPRHEAMIEQAKSDMKIILQHRINELVLGGFLTAMFAATSSVPNMGFGMLLYQPFINLIEKGVISQEEIKGLEWNTCGLKIEELNEVLENFSERIEVISVQVTKEVCPYYTQFLEDNDFEKYKDSVVKSIGMLCKLPLYSILDKPDEEKERIFELFEVELRSSIKDSVELHLEVTTLVLRKK